MTNTKASSRRSRADWNPTLPLAARIFASCSRWFSYVFHCRWQWCSIILYKPIIFQWHEIFGAFCIRTACRCNEIVNEFRIASSWGYPTISCIGWSCVFRKLCGVTSHCSWLLRCRAITYGLCVACHCPPYFERSSQWPPSGKLTHDKRDTR